MANAQIQGKLTGMSLDFGYENSFFEWLNWHEYSCLGYGWGRYSQL